MGRPRSLPQNCHAGLSKIADVLVDTLVAAGVKHVYGLAGDSLNGITDSIRTRDTIKWVPVLTELPILVCRRPFEACFTQALMPRPRTEQLHRHGYLANEVIYR